MQPLGRRPEFGHARQSLRLLPCLPCQNGQKGQSSPCGKSSPSSCGQPTFPWLSATDLTPCRRKKSFISCCTFGLVVTSVTTHRLMIGSAPSRRITPAPIFVVVLSSGPYVASVPMGYCGCWRPAPMVAGLEKEIDQLQDRLDQFDHDRRIEVDGRTLELAS